MSNVKERLYRLIENTEDSVLLENVYQYLLSGIAQEKTMLKDVLSEAELNSLNVARSEYQRGETISHAQVIELLKQWNGK